MSYRNDANSYPMNTWQDSQRGRGGYQVASGASYAPGHDYDDRSASPEPTQTYQAYRPPQQQQQQNLQPQLQPPPPPPPPHGSAADAPYPQPTLSPFRDPSPHLDTSYRGYEPPSQYSPDSEHFQSQHPQNPFYSSYTSIPGAGSTQRMSTHSGTDDPYQGQSRSQSRQGPAAFGSIDPNEILDDDDEGWGQARRKKRMTTGAAAGGGLAAGLGGLAVSKAVRDSSGSYKPVGAAGAEAGAEKSQWLLDEARKRKRRKWLALGIIGVIVVAAIVGGVIGAVVSTRNNNNSDSSAEDDGPDLTKDSASIKALMNNKNLHKVFPGMDYTPLNAQYPDCMHRPPSQNNITKDVAVLSQLTPELRLYGTDCNQTEMVLHAIDALGLGADLKIWLGVWLDKNDTTSARQLEQMYDVLDGGADTDVISGVVVGNEVLFAKYLDETQLVDVISSVRRNLTSRGLRLPVATSDLGSNWNKQLADGVDVVMANVHPFFGGIPVAQAAGWTWDFWQNNDVALTAGGDKKHTISEVGWPSAGGNDCSDGVVCPDATSGAVAGVDEMNRFMGDWVCQALANQTSYFWFEAFDEPWKIRFNKPGQEWEDKWGLMDVNRNLKKGLQIPDCGGQVAGPTTWPAPMGS